MKKYQIVELKIITLNGELDVITSSATDASDIYTDAPQNVWGKTFG